MRFCVVTIFPEMIRDYFKTGILSHAIKKGLIDIITVDLKDFAGNRYNKVDKPIFGEGKGMLFRPEPLKKALAYAKQDMPNAKVIAMTPSGQRFDNGFARNLVKENDLIIIASRYEGIDRRFLDLYVDMEISIGDYVLTGGELPALCLIDAVSRFVEGSVKSESVNADSFENGLLEHAHYTEPVEFEGLKVPDVLRSGNHNEVREWRKYDSLKRTYFQRTDLLRNYSYTIESGESKNPLTKLKKENKNRGKILELIQKIAKEWKNGRRNR